MKTNTTESIDLKNSEYSEEVNLSFEGPVSVQPVVSNLVGDITYTLQVSNDQTNFVNYDDLSTDISIVDSIHISYVSFPWKYARVLVNAKPGSSGSAKFIFVYGRQGN